MQKQIAWIMFVVFMAITHQINAQYEKQDSTYKKCFVGSTFAMLGNLLPENKPDFVQLNLGYRLTGKDVISLEFKT
jgi:hypothetical protein